MSDSEGDDVVCRQRNFMWPWQRDRGVPNSNLFPGSSTHKDDFEDRYFRQRMRQTIYNKDVDGYSRKEKYGDERADVGHIFSYENGGANEGRNGFMQERGWNRTAGSEFDHWNAAVNGYDRAEEAYKACETADRGFKDSRWGGYRPSQIVDAARDEMKEVGLLIRNGGGIDGRCRAMKRGEVNVDRYGMITGMDGKIREFKEEHDQWTGHPAYDSDDDDGDDYGLSSAVSNLRLGAR
jgi:hypothetical protein